MANNEVILKSIELIQAIEAEDLNMTKELVEYFNANPDSINNSINFHQHFSDSVAKYVNNEAFAYTLNNLKDFEDSHLRWTLQILQLQKMENNSNAIEAFIFDKIANADVLEPYQLGSVVDLCTANNRLDLLRFLYDRLKSLEEQ